jgi:hypothetical protein
VYFFQLRNVPEEIEEEIRDGLPLAVPGPGLGLSGCLARSGSRAYPRNNPPHVAPKGSAVPSELVNRYPLPYHPPTLHHPLFYGQTIVSPFISHGAHPMAFSSSSSSSNFQLIINNALDAYKKRTKNDLLAHPLAVKLQSCNTPNAILAVLQQQIGEVDQSRSSDDRWTRWLDPTVNVLFALSETLGEGVGLVCLIT